MCKHCDRIIEDVESKPIVHEFMAHVAAGMTKRGGGPVVTADDIDVTIEVTNWKVARAMIEAKLKDPTLPGTVIEPPVPDARQLDAAQRLATRATRMINECFGVPGQ